MSLSRLIQKFADVDLGEPPLSATILLIDDQASVAAMTQAMLEELGHTAIVKTDALGALHELATNPDLDLVIADIVMPGALGGPDIAEFAREMAGLETILISAFPYHRMTLDSIGKYQVLLKPFLTEELGEHIRAALKAR